MKSVLITDYTQIKQCKHCKGGVVDVIMSKLTFPKKSLNVHKIWGIYVQCVNNHNIQSLNMKE